jgi:hypothetical protein
MKRALTFAALVSLTLTAAGAITKDPGPIPELRPPRTELTETAENKRDLLPWFIATGIIAVVAAILASIPRKQTAPPTPPYVTAQRKLSLLKPADATPENLMLIFREYLLNAFNIPACGATTAELIHWLSAHPRWDAKFEAETSELLDSCDEAKFSPIPPLQPPVSNERILLLISRIEERRRLAASPASVTSQP